MKTTHSFHWVFVIIAVAALQAVGSAYAATLSVTNTSDAASGSLRQAIASAGSGDQIIFQIPTTDSNYDSTTHTFTINLTAGLTISKSLSILGGTSRVVVRRGPNAGSGIYFQIFIVTAGNVVLENLMIRDGVGSINGSNLHGGNIRNSGNLLVRGCTISNGKADGSGGGIFNNGTLFVVNSTVTQNRAVNGSGIYNSSSLTVRSSTIVNNNGASFDPAYGLSNAGTARLGNTIVSGNDQSSASRYDVKGAFISEGYNLIGTLNGASGFTATGDQTNVGDVSLGSLGDNGGPTDTMLPNPGSLAIDNGIRVLNADGTLLQVDQRGRPRPIDLSATNAPGGDGSDVGAVEVDQPQVGPDFVVTNTDEHTDGVCGVGDCTLLEALDASNADASANTITFAPGVSGTIINSSRFGQPIKHPLTIIGPGARTLTIDGKSNARIFDVRAGAGSVTISGLTLANGKALVAGGSTFPVGYGGAILNAASLTLNDCTLTGNSSAVAGGAILNNGSSSGNATLILNNCTLTGNSAATSAGAIFNLGGASGHATLNLTNCTLDQNSASEHGGAIYSDGTNAGSAALTLTNCTFNQNTATLTAGGICNDAFNEGQAQGVATLILRNTIIRGGANGANLVNDQGTITSQGSNLSSDAAGGDTATGPGGFLNQAGDIRNTDPKLGTLQNNGGSTDTVALAADSPAINAGNDSFAPSTDQRGQPRIGVSDIGAFEFTSAPTPTPTATPTATPTPVPGSLGNVSTRLQVGTGDNVLFAGFIIQGNASKTVLIRSAGPSLTQFGVPGALGNPQLELHDANNTIGTNDDWQTTQIGGVISSDQVAAIQNSGAPPSDPAEPAIIATLPAGGYTAIVQGVGGAQGVATVEVYDLSPNNGAVLANISTRGFIQTGDNVMIGGFIVVGQSSNVLVRATGPSLIPFGINNALANPQLELHDANGTLAGNDDWQTTQLGGIITSDQSAAIQNSGLAPGDPAESAIIATLAPGNYTAIAQGVNGGTGVGLIEVFALP